MYDAILPDSVHVEMYEDVLEVTDLRFGRRCTTDRWPRHYPLSEPLVEGAQGGQSMMSHYSAGYRSR